MGKTVFRPNEINTRPGSKMTLQLIHDYAPVEEVKEVVEEYTGPTPDQLRKEAEAFKKGFEIEKQHMIDEAQRNAEEIVKRAQDTALEAVNSGNQEVLVIRANAEAEAQKIIDDAKAEAERIIANANAEQEAIKIQARETGKAEGHADGFKAGEEEQNRLVERIHKIIESIMTRREEILKETESQIVELVLIMTRKVVKVLTDTQKTVIANNVLAALNKVKTRGNVTLRVNMEDAKITTANLNEFTKRVENVQAITVVEDSTVGKGGCIVETDFGEIDATIQHQLQELEAKIIEISPVKSVSKTKQS